MSKYIITEDDVAPDARQEFSKELQKITGYNLEEFKGKGTKVENSISITYMLDGYALSTTADHPFWRLRRIPNL